MKVFLAVPLAYNRSIERTRLMGKAIRNSGHELVSPWNLDPLEVSAPSAVNVFNRDRIGSENADVMVADVTDPSIGVGMEIMAAFKAGKRIILVLKKGRPIPGIIRDMEGAEKLEYDEESEIYDRLLKMLS
jgi:hypothetical protein